MLIEIEDDVIWAKHLKADPALYQRVVKLKDEETIRLEVDESALASCNPYGPAFDRP